MPRTEDHERIADAAGDWFARLHLEEPSDEDRERFRIWCRQDQRHANAYKRLADIWHDSAVLDVADVSSAGESHSRRRRIPLAAYAAAATVLFAIATIVYLRTGLFDADRFATQTAEVRDVALPDGSTLTLGARSTVSVRFTKSQRDITLDAGQAYFTVARNPSRPFVVIAGDSRVRAIGTQFEVRRDGSDARVAVVEGIVEVSRPGELARTLSAGQQLVTRAGGEIEPPQQIQTPEPAAWRNGRLVYIDAPLSEIVADANRYSQRQIDLAGLGIENLRVSVTYRADQVNEMIESLPRTLPVELVPADNERVTLRSRAQER